MNKKLMEILRKELEIAYHKGASDANRLRQGISVDNDWDLEIKSTQAHDQIMELWKEDLRKALARGYCTERNKHKVLDPDLIEDMVTQAEKNMEGR